MKYYFRCPNCGSDEQFVTPSEENSGLGCALFVFGGFLPALLFASHNQGRIQCTKCAHIFSQPPLPGTPLAEFATWILALTVLPTIVAVFFFLSAEAADLLPSIPVIATVEKAVIAQPRVAAYLLALLFVLVAIPSWITILVSKAKHRKQLSKEYRLEPLSSEELLRQNRTRPATSTENPNA